jgi:hypothetical protein
MTSGIVRMGADRAKDVRIFFCNREHLRVLLNARRNRDDAADASGARAPKDRVDFRRKIGKIEVAMAVHEHGQALSSAST